MNETTRQNHWNLFYSFVCLACGVRIDEKKKIKNRNNVNGGRTWCLFFSWAFGGLDLSFLSFFYSILNTINGPKFFTSFCSLFELNNRHFG